MEPKTRVQSNAGSPPVVVTPRGLGTWNKACPRQRRLTTCCHWPALLWNGGDNMSKTTQANHCHASAWNDFTLYHCRLLAYFFQRSYQALAIARPTTTRRELHTWLYHIGQKGFSLLGPGAARCRSTLPTATWIMGRQCWLYKQNHRF